ncbi:DUF2750 domain-containing protein [Thalassotalea ganghwensis]
MIELTEKEVEELANLSEEKRTEYFFTEVIKCNQLWILVDEHGSVMLNSDEGDCIPVWPNKELAQLWANEEWQACQPHAIKLKEWLHRWTSGLVGDDISVIVFPNDSLTGKIYDPEYIAKKLTPISLKQ